MKPPSVSKRAMQRAYGNQARRKERLAEEAAALAHERWMRAERRWAKVVPIWWPETELGSVRRPYRG